MITAFLSRQQIPLLINEYSGREANNSIMLIIDHI